MGKMVITDAGIAEVVNAENTGTAPVTLTHIGFGTGQYTATAERTALQAEFKRFDAISGGGVGDNVFHVTMEDDSADAYTVYEVGVFTESGTLFAVYSQTTPIIEKSASSIGMLAVDILLDEMNPESVTIGDTNFELNPATTERKGVIEIATEEEAKAATDTERAITAATLDATIEAHDNIVHRSGAETIAGNKTFTGSIISSASQSIVRKTDTSSLLIVGATTWEKGGYLILRGVDSVSDPGIFSLCARGDVSKLLSGYPDGKLIWDGKNIVRTINGNNADANGNITPAQTGCLPLTGGTMTGAINFSGNTDMTILIDSDGDLIVGDKDLTDGGSVLRLRSAENETNPGGFQLRAKSIDGNEYYLIGYSDGTLTWGGKAITLKGDCLPLSGGTMAGAINFTGNTEQKIYVDEHGDLLVGDNDTGALLRVRGNNSEDNSGGFQFRAQDADNTTYLIGKPDGTLTWGGNPVTALPAGESAGTLYVGASREIKTLADAFAYMNRYSVGNNKKWTVYLDNGEYDIAGTYAGVNAEICPTSGSYSTNCRIKGTGIFRRSFVRFVYLHFGGTSNGATDCRIDARHCSYINLTNCTFYAGPGINYSFVTETCSIATITGCTFYGRNTNNTTSRFQSIRVSGGGYAVVANTKFIAGTGEDTYAVYCLNHGQVHNGSGNSITGYTTGFSAMYNSGITLANTNITYTNVTTKSSPAFGVVGNNNSYITA